MANYKEALKKLEEEKKTNIEEGKIREHDLKSGLADRIVEKHWDKQDKKWKVEYAKEILKEKNKKC
ncbi:MAG: hypothetical protein ACI4PU_03870 [Intestinibacter sp.]